MKRLIPIVAIAVVALGAPAQAAVNTGAADFSMYVALGDSLTAGYASGGLVFSHQEASYPNVVAQQVGVTGFQQPIVSAPGIPPVMELVHLVPDPVLLPADDEPGFPLNAEYPFPYNNLGVPGSNLNDLLNTTGDIYNLLAGNQDNVMHDLVLRDGEHTALEQAISLEPTFVTMWIGNNDILGAALYATPLEGVTMTPVADFEAMYTQAAGALAQYTDADMVFFTIPDVAAIPFVTTVDPFLTLPDGSHVPIIGSNGPLPEDAYVTLQASALLAQGIGVPTELGGTGVPLPEDLQVTAEGVVPGFVLRPNEVAVISERIAAFNTVIRNVAATVGAEVLDINDIFSRVQDGYFIYGGFELTTDFLTGGVFSYDGVHPQNVGYALIASELIDLLNTEFRAKIPQISLYDILTGGVAYTESGAMTTQDVPVYTGEAFESLRQAFPLLGPVPTGQIGVVRDAERMGSALSLQQ